MLMRFILIFPEGDQQPSVSLDEQSCGISPEQKWLKAGRNFLERESSEIVASGRAIPFSHFPPRSYFRATPGRPEPAVAGFSSKRCMVSRMVVITRSLPIEVLIIK